MQPIFNRFRRTLAVMAGAFCLGQPVMASADTAEGWTATDDDALLFDVRLGKYRLGEGVRGYQTPDGVCIDLADTIMALDVPVRLDKKLRRATGWAFSEDHTLIIDREAKLEQIANNKRALAATAVRDTPEGWCVSIAAAERWFGIGFNADLTNAVLVIKADKRLPVELAMDRRDRAARLRPAVAFDLKTLPQSKIAWGGPIKPPALDVVVAIGGQRDKGRAQGHARYSVYASGEIGPVAYDARLASNETAVPESLRLRAYRTDPEGGLFGPLKATEAAAGDVEGVSTRLSALSSVGRGVALTNRPVERPDTFDRTSFRGELPVGWDAELYRNGQLLAFVLDRADGRYEFLDVPLLYGRNRFEIVVYGPQGQVKREEHVVTVGQDSIPPRDTWYAASLLQDGKDLIDFSSTPNALTGKWRGTIALERGIDSRTAVALAYNNLFVREVGRRNFFEGSVRRAIGPSLVELTGATDLRGGYALGGQMLAQFGNTYVSAESTKAMGGFRSDRLRSGITGEHRLGVDQIVTLGRSIVPVHIDTGYTTRADGRRTIEGEARLSTTVRRQQLTGLIEWEQDRLPRGPDPPGRITAGLLANMRIKGLSLRGEARYRVSPQQRFESATLIGEWSGKGEDQYRASWRAELGYQPEAGRTRFGVGYVRRFDTFALSAQAAAATDGSLAAGLNLSFSLGPDPRRKGGFRVTSSRIAAQGQILARVYRDLNSDGMRQSDEPWEKNVQLTAGMPSSSGGGGQVGSTYGAGRGLAPVRGLTDANGEVIIEELRPFHPVLVGIDTSALDDPMVQPRGPGVVVTPRPGVAGVVELALTGAGEVDGTLMREGGSGMEGVDLELVDARGAVIATTRTDFDGYFLFESVPYGRYSVRIARVSADIVQVQQALGVEAAVNGDAPTAHLGTLSARAGPPQTAVK